jgi:hypothetical protein
MCKDGGNLIRREEDIQVATEPESQGASVALLFRPPFCSPHVSAYRLHACITSGRDYLRDSRLLSILVPSLVHLWITGLQYSSPCLACMGNI